MRSRPLPPVAGRSAIKHRAAPFGGASRSLLELIQSFTAGAVQPRVLTRRGQFQEILAAAGVEVRGCDGVSQFDNTRRPDLRSP